MISRFRYPVSILIALIVFVLFFLWCIFPLAQSAGGRFVKTLTEANALNRMAEKQESPDSLLYRYRLLSEKMDSFLTVKGSASDILKHLLALSQNHRLNLLDLSTREPETGSKSIEYPVSFLAEGSFTSLHRFLTDVENSEFCVKVSSLRIERNDSGNAKAFVELSVFIREDTP
ncbi:MAG: type 4a pilus biogenesis protein PilO [Fibrobacter sp.]|nr:type 4a pilus biogenesis protein PilO [Fibrobacter sp.]